MQCFVCRIILNSAALQAKVILCKYMLYKSSNAFNSLNRKVAMKNIKLVCLNLSHYIENTYQDAARLYIAGGSQVMVNSYSHQKTQPKETILRWPFMLLVLSQL